MTKIRKIFNILLGLFILIISSLTAPSTIGEEINQTYFLNLDKTTVSRGYTVTAFANAVKLNLSAGILKDATGVEIVQINEDMPTPWQLERLSDIYQFEFKNKTAYDQTKAFYIDIKFNINSNYYKQIYYYDKNYASWKPLFSKDLTGKSIVRASISLPFARLAVFANKEVPVVGKASWYSYKKGNFAASPDFPKKSKLRVYNTDNGKFVDVEINDFGPDRKKHPDRVIDLDKVAFLKIAAKSQGVANVRIEPLYIAPQTAKVLGIKIQGATVEPLISAKSAILMNEQNGQIIWQKNASSTLPLASLTKLVAVKVFLDMRPTLNQVVTYKIQDENYNYQYCNKWESAKVTLKDGDTLTIENLVYSALVGSANNAIESLVRVSGLTRQQFIEKMNETVAGWRALATHFTEPTGLSPDNVSSASDYAIITKEVFTHPIIQKAATMPLYKFSTINTKKPHSLKNTNQLLSSSSLVITGSKTGYLDEALYCLMVRAKDGSGGNIIAVTMGVPTREASFIETEELVKYGIYINSRNP